MNGSNAWLIIRLYVNGTIVKQWTVSSTSYANYMTHASTAVIANAQVDVVFTNACGRRKLTVDYVILPTLLGNRKVQEEGSGTVFDRGSENGGAGGSSFDGVNVVNGVEEMTETGALHFVVGLDALATGYDANGNMTLRLKDGARYYLSYDAENRLTGVSGAVSATFVYNGDGQRVTATIGSTTTYIGNYFEWKGDEWTSYYYAGSTRIAMRTRAGVEYLLGDHLGSTSLTVNSTGDNPRELRYYPWGEVRYTSGTTPTDYRFTGQQEVALIGLYYYGARFYDPSLGRFLCADSIVPNPGDPASFDRYSYVRNSPLKYVDPSGHRHCTAREAATGDETCEQNYENSAEDLREWLFSTYGWNVMGNWTYEELVVLFEVARDIITYVDEITDGQGEEWFGKHLEDLNIIHDGIPGNHYVWGNTVHLLTGAWINDPDPHGVFAHELGHIWDNRTGTGLFQAINFGGGVADALVMFVGVNPSGIRWCNGTSGIPADYQWHGGYGDHSTADYLADSFRYMIYDNSMLPQVDILNWLNAVISLQTQQIGGQR